MLHQLPLPVPHFTNRAEELQQVTQPAAALSLALVRAIFSWQERIAFSHGMICKSIGTEAIIAPA